VLPEFSILYELLWYQQGVTLSPHQARLFIRLWVFTCIIWLLTQESDSEGCVDWADLLGLEWRNTGFALSDTSQSSRVTRMTCQLCWQRTAQILIWMTQALTWVILIRTPGMMVMMKKWRGGHILGYHVTFRRTYQGHIFALLWCPLRKPIPKAPPQTTPCSHRA